MCSRCTNLNYGITSVCTAIMLKMHDIIIIITGYMHEKEIINVYYNRNALDAHNKYDAPAGTCMPMSYGLAERGAQTFKHGMTRKVLAKPGYHNYYLNSSSTG